MKTILPRISYTRICSIVLLLVAMLTLSGIAATAGALVLAEAGSACCDNDADRKHSGSDSGSNSGSVPCSVPDCACAFCLTIDLPALPTVSRVPATLVLSFTPQQRVFPLSEFISSIDYPPEAC